MCVYRQKFPGLFIHDELIIRMTQIEDSELLVSGKGSEDVVWLGQGILIVIICSGRGSLTLCTLIGLY